jgi:probable F420-dependent oxidoreductase
MNLAVPARAMQVGVSLPHSLRRSHERMLEFAAAAEALGFDSIWVTEHIVVPLRVESRYPYSVGGVAYWDHEAPWLEAMVTLGFLAGATRRLRLGTSVIPAMTRDPLSLAKQAATVDVLSGGRLELGIGAGWCHEEAHALGHPSDHPVGRLGETIEIMRKAWSESSFEHHGRFWDLPEVGVHPHPAQGSAVPIWVGGDGPRLLRMAAEQGDGVFLAPARADRVADVRAALPAGKQVGVPFDLEGDAETVHRRVHELRDQGADVAIGGSTADEARVFALLERFAGTTLASLRTTDNGAFESVG